MENEFQEKYDAYHQSSIQFVPEVISAGLFIDPGVTSKQVFSQSWILSNTQERPPIHSEWLHSRLFMQIFEC